MSTTIGRCRRRRSPWWEGAALIAVLTCSGLPVARAAPAIQADPTPHHIVAAPTVVAVALVDDFDLPHREELESMLRRPDDVGDIGPYARPTADLVAGSAASIGRLLSRYDVLVAEARTRPDRMVLTHGEPHPGNTMRSVGGWLLIDWDTALVAPPERDLWGLDPGDGSILAAYEAATRVSPLPSMVELHRIRWDLADLAVYVSRFRRPHVGDADDEQSWAVLQPLVARLGA